MTDLWIVMTHEGYGESTEAYGVYSSEAKAKDAIKRSADDPKAGPRSNVFRCRLDEDGITFAGQFS